VRNLLSLLQLQAGTRVYVPRRPTLADVIARAARAEQALALAPKTSADPQAASEADEIGGLPLLENCGPAVTEGLVLLRCALTRFLAAQLAEERSVLGFAAQVAEGAEMERGRFAEHVQMVPTPAAPQSLRSLLLAVNAQPRPEDGAPPEVTLRAAGGAFSLAAAPRAKARRAETGAEAAAEEAPAPGGRRGSGPVRLSSEAACGTARGVGAVEAMFRIAQFKQFVREEAERAERQARRTGYGDVTTTGRPAGKGGAGRPRFDGTSRAGNRPKWPTTES